MPHRQVAIGADGEILLGGRTLCLGYLDGERLAPAAGDGGWFASGDLGRLDGGRLSVTGRRDARFISGGENIQPEEVEQALREHPAVLAAVCVAVPDPEFGSRPAAFLVLESGSAAPRGHGASSRSPPRPLQASGTLLRPSGDTRRYRRQCSRRRHQVLPQYPRRPCSSSHHRVRLKPHHAVYPVLVVIPCRADASTVPAMNFNATNNTFRQLMGNGLSYRVPLFQRDYSWGPDEWDDLWQDIVALFGDDPEPAHYMGYLVLQSADNRAFDTIDGQQRMTTLSLLMLAAVSHLSDLAAPDDPRDPQTRRAEQLRASYLGYLDPVSLVPRSKLTLNRHNDSFYQNYLVPLERLPQRGLNASEHLLRRAFFWFKERIRERAEDRWNSGRQLRG